MRKEYVDPYYYKLLYFNGYKALYSSNYQYFSNLIINEKCKVISDYITKIRKNNFSVALKDKVGCAGGYILQNVVENLKPENVFEIISDVSESDEIMAVFCPKNNLFIFFTGEQIKCFSLNLSNCYTVKNFDRQGLSYAKYLSLSEKFLLLSKSYS